MAGTNNNHIAKLTALLALISAATGYSPTQWRHGLNVMLKKSPWNIDMECLQVILLFKADCNHNKKWLGCVL